MQIIRYRWLRALLTPFILGGIIFGGALHSQEDAGINESRLILPAKTCTIPFQWQGDSVSSEWEPHAALMIPVRLKNCPRLFFMQFDLGSPYTLFYRNKLADIQSRYPRVLTPNVQGDKLPYFTFTAGRTTVLAKEIPVKQFDSTSINWEDKNGIEIIGTIGADLIDGRVVVIDYPGKKLIVSPTVPEKLISGLSMTDFIYQNRRVLLPARLRDRQVLLFFDTGSSMYELLTDKKTAEGLGIPGGSIIRSKVKSWGRSLTANSIPTSERIEIAGNAIPLHYSTYIDGVSNGQAEQMMKMGIGGMTGNKLFVEYKLVLDTKNKKFGLVRPD